MNICTFSSSDNPWLFPILVISINCFESSLCLGIALKWHFLSSPYVMLQLKWLIFSGDVYLKCFYRLETLDGETNARLVENKRLVAHFKTLNVIQQMQDHCHLLSSQDYQMKCIALQSLHCRKYRYFIFITGNVASLFA